MPHSQLENDLMKNAHDRLVRWRTDTRMRCDAVDVPQQTQISLVFTCLVGELVNMAAMLKISDEDFATLMQFALRDWKRRTTEAKNKSVEDEKRA